MKFHTATSGEDGGYELTGLLPGTYQLSRMPGDLNLDLEDFMEKFVGDIETHNLKLAAGRTTPAGLRPRRGRGWAR